MDAPTHTTELLLKLGNGDEAAADRLTPLVYDELHAVSATPLRFVKALAAVWEVKQRIEFLQVPSFADTPQLRFD